MQKVLPTGGKFKFSSKVGTGFKIGGWVLGAYNARVIYNQYADGQLNFNKMIVEEVSNGISTFGGIYGAAWGLGWSLGKDYGPSKWYGWNDDKWFE